METKGGVKDKFFIVTGGKARKGFSRGCIGHVESVTQDGELMGLVYGGGSSVASAKSGGAVEKKDTYLLSRHQAQLLLFVSPPSKRLELLCNPQLFAAICELSQDDLVVLKHKKGYSPGLVKNLMQIGRKENPGDLLMLGFEVEFVDTDQTVSSKKPAPLPLFSAADIVQVVPAYSVPIGLRWKDRHSDGLTRKAVSRINSMPHIGSHVQNVKESHIENGFTKSQSPELSHIPLEVGSMVEVESNTGVIVYGVIWWMGVPEGKKSTWAGIELDYEMNGCSDGRYEGRRYFTCRVFRALFVPLTKCNPDRRFLCPPTEKEMLEFKEIIPVTPLEEMEEDAPPIPESKALSLLVGKMKGIQGHFNSCYLDATLFSLFSSSMTLDSVCHKPADTDPHISHTLLKDIVNHLRRHGFVPADSVMNFRKQLGCDSFVSEEKDPEEFITILLQRLLCMEPLLKLRSSRGTSQDAYTFQIILEKEQVGLTPTVQQLLDTSFLSCDLKFEEVPSCLMVQMPRFGKRYKMFPHIIPSTELDITDLLYNSPRDCFLCGRLAEYECPQCQQDRRLQPGKIKQYCTICKTQVHTHPSRLGHCPRALTVPAEISADAPVPRHKMHLFAVLCIQTSHYVSFVKYGPNPHSWLFFDSMADRYGDDQTGYNIPEIRACPEVGDFLSQTEEELVQADPSQAGEPLRRLLSDSYMCFYQSEAMVLER